MATITPAVDVPFARVGVTLASFSPDGPITVNRIHEDGSRHPVRGMSAVSGGAAFGWDYETPLSVPVHYEADSAGVTITSSAVTLTVASRAMLTVPGLPSFGGPVTVASRPQLARSRPQVALDILGRETRIIKSDILKAATFTLSLLTKSDAEAYSLTSMVAVAPVLLLRVPGTRVTDWCYISIGDVSEVPVSRVLPPTMPTEGDITTWAGWQVGCEVTDAPVGGIIGDPTSTWQALKDTGKTWQQVRDMGLTWLDVLQGEAIV